MSWSGPAFATARYAMSAMAEAKEFEREECASAVEHITMGDVLLAVGELSASERRVVKALLPWIANRIRNRVRNAQ